MYEREIGSIFTSDDLRVRNSYSLTEIRSIETCNDCSFFQSTEREEERGQIWGLNIILDCYWRQITIAQKYILGIRANRMFVLQNLKTADKMKYTYIQQLRICLENYRVPSLYFFLSRIFFYRQSLRRSVLGRRIFRSELSCSENDHLDKNFLR